MIIPVLKFYNQKKQIRHEYDLKLKKVEERRLAQEEEQKEKEE